MDYIEQKKLESKQMNMSVGYILWFFLGQFGAHRFYCKKNHGVTMLVLEIVAWILICTVIGMIIGIPIIFAVMIWWLIDAFKVQKWINEFNLSVVEEYSRNNESNSKLQSNNHLDILEKLSKLKNSGAISEEEFIKEKSKVLENA
ncbi:NINE protein [Fangia hongkongensis]|uniref:NINE protein n=1 Tax=Fangia hongkongensis TaxID=270495 RepID=UPI000372C24F|nr:NINE protein [Fangia hongkongensis]